MATYFGIFEAKSGLINLRALAREVRRQADRSFGDRRRVPEVQAIFDRLDDLDAALAQMGSRVKKVNSNFLEDYLVPEESRR